MEDDENGCRDELFAWKEKLKRENREKNISTWIHLRAEKVSEYIHLDSFEG